MNPGNKENRGCFSQNGSRCLAQKGRFYHEMLRFYYGADIQIETASGACIVPPPPDQGPPLPDGSPSDLPLASDRPRGADLRPPGLDGWKPPADSEANLPDASIEIVGARGGCAVGSSSGRGGNGTAPHALLLMVALAVVGGLGRRKQTPH